jgi:hypothetical protein
MLHPPTFCAEISPYFAQKKESKRRKVTEEPGNYSPVLLPESHAISHILSESKYAAFINNQRTLPL